MTKCPKCYAVFSDTDVFCHKDETKLVPFFDYNCYKEEFLLNHCTQCNRVYNKNIETCYVDHSELKKGVFATICSLCKKYITLDKFCHDDGRFALTDPYSLEEGLGLIGQVILEKYLVTQPISRIGKDYIHLGKDFLAEDLKTSNTVIVTALRLYSANRNKAEDEIKDAVEKALRVKHKNVIAVLDYDFSTNTLIREFVDNSINLSTLLGNKVKLPPQQILKIVRQICLGLDEVSKKGIIYHHPFSPEDVEIFYFNEKQEVVKINCFAKDGRTVEPIETCGVSPYYPGNFRYGTPGAALKDKDLVYCLGILICKMLTGEFPYKVKDSYGYWVLMHMRPMPIPLRELDSFVPEQVESVVLRMLSKEIKNRPSLIEAMKLLEESWKNFKLDGSTFSEQIEGNAAKNLTDKNTLTFFEHAKKRFGNNVGKQLTKLINTGKFNGQGVKESKVIEIGSLAWIKVITNNYNICLLFDGEGFVVNFPSENDLAKSLSVVLKEAKARESDIEYALDALPKLFFYYSPPKVIKTQQDLDEALSKWHRNITLPYSNGDISCFSMMDVSTAVAYAKNVYINWQTYEVTIKQAQEREGDLPKLKPLFEKALKQNRPNAKDWLQVARSFPDHYIYPNTLEIVETELQIANAFLSGHRTAKIPCFANNQLSFSVIPTHITPKMIWNVTVDWNNYSVDIVQKQAIGLNRNELSDFLVKRFNKKATEKLLLSLFSTDTHKTLLIINMFSFEWLRSYTVHYGGKEEHQYFLYLNGDFLDLPPKELFVKVLKNKKPTNESWKEILDFYSSLVNPVLKTYEDLKRASVDYKYYEDRWIEPNLEGNKLKFLTICYTWRSTMTIDVKTFHLEQIEVDLENYIVKEVPNGSNAQKMKEFQKETSSSNVSPQENKPNLQKQGIFQTLNNFFKKITRWR